MRASLVLLLAGVTLMAGRARADDGGAACPAGCLSAGGMCTGAPYRRSCTTDGECCCAQGSCVSCLPWTSPDGGSGGTCCYPPPPSCAVFQSTLGAGSCTECAEAPEGTPCFDPDGGTGCGDLLSCVPVSGKPLCCRPAHGCQWGTGLDPEGCPACNVAPGGCSCGQANDAALGAGLVVLAVARRRRRRAMSIAR
ncbi:MAG TPA: hypothetical protein VMB50_16390 [Myxococcales bacterium]|nr:hypothetical protein [Myxococcales bacterium]